MANFPDTPSWAPIYQLDRQDLADAGENGDGPANKQGKQLAGRTAWLKQEHDTLKQSHDDLQNALGSAAGHAETDFATAAQGTKADAAIPATEKGSAAGVATLDAAGLIPIAQLPAGAATQVLTAASDVEQAALDASLGDLCKRLDAAAKGATYVRLSSSNADMTDWLKLNQTIDVTEAPNDGQQYVRQGKAWTQMPEVEFSNIAIVDTEADMLALTPLGIMLCVRTDENNRVYVFPIDDGAGGDIWKAIDGLEDAPADGKQYARKDGTWAEVAAGAITADAPSDGKDYVRKNAAWAEASYLPDAPADGKQYARKDNAWAEVTAGDTTHIPFGPTISANKTLAAADSGNTFEVSASATVTLPALSAVSIGWNVTLSPQDSGTASAFTITLAPQGADTIRGGLTTATGDLVIVAGATQWLASLTA